MAAIFYGNGIEGSEKVKEVHFAAKIKIKFIIVWLKKNCVDFKS